DPAVREISRRDQVRRKLLAANDCRRFVVRTIIDHGISDAIGLEMSQGIAKTDLFVPHTQNRDHV
ncbi:MAG TPA: hypothetical protein VFP29_03555, partial [Methyloceanibacter sp.]|nr:hypothetical protein [Methyloceanibacter sp.]